MVKHLAKVFLNELMDFIVVLVPFLIFPRTVKKINRGKSQGKMPMSLKTMPTLSAKKITAKAKSYYFGFVIFK